MSPIDSLRTLSENIQNQTTRAETLVGQSLDKAERSDSTFVSVDHSILENARDVDKAIQSGSNVPPLSGIPITLKDLFNLKGEKTLAGSVALKHSAQPADQDCDVVKPLRDAGLLFLGRTNMSEFAFSGMGMNPHYGTPKSIWDRDTGRLPGGSSSGSAVSVAEGIVAATMGSDTAGSCRIPASFNGIVGVKPSYGRLSLNGVYPLSPTSDAPGPLGVDVDSCFLLDQLISGAWNGRGELPTLQSRAVNGLKLLVPEGVVTGELDDEVAGDFQRALDALKGAGAEIQFQAMPVIDDCVTMFLTRAVAGHEAYAHHQEIMEAYGDEYDPYVFSRISSFGNVSDEEQQARYRDKAVLRSTFTEEMKQGGYDAIIYPTTACIPPRIVDAQVTENTGKVNLRCLRNTASANYFDGCSASLPMHSKGSAPTGLMVSSVHGDDAGLYEVMAGVEDVLKQMLS